MNLGRIIWTELGVFAQRPASLEYRSTHHAKNNFQVNQNWLNNGLVLKSIKKTEGLHFKETII